MSLDPDTTFAALKQVAGWPHLPVWAKMDSARACAGYEALPQERKDAMLVMPEWRRGSPARCVSRNAKKKPAATGSMKMGSTGVMH